MIDVRDFNITLTAEAKFWSHGIDTDQVYAVLDHPRTAIRNRPNRAAPDILLGRDDQGQCLAIPIAPTDHPTIWHPVTAWYCRPGEIAKLRQRRGIMEESTRYAALQEPLDDEERDLMDSDSWDWDHPIEVRTVGKPGAVLRLHFSREEYVALSRLARAQGLSTHELIKRAALAVIGTPEKEAAGSR
jgi:hypothetical protein